MSREPTAIERILATIPDEIRFRVPGDRRGIEPEKTAPKKAEPKAVAPEPIQPSLFETENHDGR